MWPRVFLREIEGDISYSNAALKKSGADGDCRPFRYPVISTIYDLNLSVLVLLNAATALICLSNVHFILV
jgi:hypothetical protein